MTTLDRNGLFGKAKVRYCYVGLPDGDKVRLRSLSEKEKSAFETDILSTKGAPRRDRMEDAKRRLMILCAVDDEGKQLLTRADMEQLEEMDGAITSLIYNKAREHCGFEEDDLEDAVKNSSKINVED